MTEHATHHRDQGGAATLAVPTGPIACDGCEATRTCLTSTSTLAARSPTCGSTLAP